MSLDQNKIFPELLRMSHVYSVSLFLFINFLKSVSLLYPPCYYIGPRFKTFTSYILRHIGNLQSLHMSTFQDYGLHLYYERIRSVSEDTHSRTVS